MESYIDMVNVIVLCCAGKIIIIISSILIRVSFLKNYLCMLLGC